MSTPIDEQASLAAEIADSARRFAADQGGLQRARALRDAWPRFDDGAWRQMSEQAWPGILVPEAHGGLGLGLREACALLEAVGRSLTPEPLAATIASGYLLAALADLGKPADRAKPDAAGELAALLAGQRIHLPVAAAPVLPRRLAAVSDGYPGSILLLGGLGDEGFELCALDGDAAGITTERFECVDGSVLADLECAATARASLRRLGGGEPARALFETALDIMRLGHGAYLAGLMDAALQLSLDYMNERVQFGVPISSFQALQHRAATAYVDIAASRTLVYEACRAFGSPGQARAAAAVKARSSAAALRVTQECVQFQGAIGFTDENDIGLYLRKAMAVAARLGGERENRRRYASLTGSP